MSEVLIDKIKTLADAAGDTAKIALGTPGDKVILGDMEMDTGSAWEVRQVEFEAAGDIMTVIVDKINELITALESSGALAPAAVAPLDAESF